MLQSRLEHALRETQANLREWRDGLELEAWVSIFKHIIEDHVGRIWVPKEARERGSSFALCVGSP